MTRQELFAAYAAGRRDFRGADLTCADLTCAAGVGHPRSGWFASEVHPDLAALVDGVTP